MEIHNIDDIIEKFPNKDLRNFDTSCLTEEDISNIICTYYEEEISSLYNFIYELYNDIIIHFYTEENRSEIIASMVFKLKEQIKYNSNIWSRFLSEDNYIENIWDNRYTRYYQIYYIPKEIPDKFKIENILKEENIYRWLIK